MAEVLGAIASGITLAALFKACIEAFDLIQTSKRQELDFRKLKLRLDIEKCRLYIWGESMGLTGDARDDQPRLIDTCRFPDTVRTILEVVFQSFHDSQKITEKYGCRQSTPEELLLKADRSGPSNRLATSFSNFTFSSTPGKRAPKALQNAFWVIHDRKKFSMLVSEVKDLVDSLHGITSPAVPVARQAGTMRRKIADIQDAETLSLIAEVCSEDHPDIADAASTKADTISLASTHRHAVATWADNVEDEGEKGKRSSPDIESLTVTELIHKVFLLEQEKKEREKPPSAPVPEHPSPSSYVNTSASPAPSALLQPVSASTEGQSRYSLSSMGYDNMPYPMVPQFTNPWANVGSSNTTHNPGDRSSFRDAVDKAHGMMAMSQTEITPRAIYGSRITPSSTSDTYGFPSTHSTHSSVSTSSYQYPSYYAGSAAGSMDDPTDHSSATSDLAAGYDMHRVQSGSHAPAPQSMMAQFSNKVPSSVQKKHKCKVCGKRWRRPSSLQTHMYTHTGEKPFACEFPGCGRNFAVVSNLRRHRKVHKNYVDIGFEKESGTDEVDMED